MDFSLYNHFPSELQRAGVVLHSRPRRLCLKLGASPHSPLDSSHFFLLISLSSTPVSWPWMRGLG